MRSAAYLEQLLQSKPSRITFPDNHVQRKAIKTSIPGLTLYPRAELYVFCLFDVKERSEANVLDTQKWHFYPVAAHVIESKYRGKKMITLKEVERVAPSVRILSLRRAIDGVIEGLNAREPQRA